MSQLKGESSMLVNSPSRIDDRSSINAGENASKIFDESEAKRRQKLKRKTAVYRVRVCRLCITRFLDLSSVKFLMDQRAS